jgi:hypothetical protein
MNPLIIQLPGRVMQLPSKGVFYNGVLHEDVKDGEIHVKPMSALAELKMKNADLLYSGKAVNEICRECIPEIKHPSKLLGKDVDAIFLFLQLATFGAMRSINSMHNCEKGSIHKHEINIEEIINNVNTSVLNNWTVLYENLELSNGFKINIKPVLFSDSIEIMQLKYKLSELGELGEHNNANAHNVLEEIFIKDTLSIIKSVVTPTGTVVDNEEHIKEWIKTLSSAILKEIEQYNTAANTSWGYDFKVKLTCPDCGEKYDHDLDLNPVSFSNG